MTSWAAVKTASTAVNAAMTVDASPPLAEVAPQPHGDGTGDDVEPGHRELSYRARGRSSDSAIE